ncbi:MAG: thermonuclease family protein [Desulfuromonadales bacterium]
MRTAVSVFIFIILFFPFNCFSEICQIVEVYDGDTIELKCNKTSITMDLYGIDCPEISQEFGVEAAEKVSSYVGIDLYAEMNKFKKEVNLFLNGKSISYDLLENGLAWSKGGKEYDVANKIEKIAREKRINIWSKNILESPENYRKRLNISSNNNEGYKLLVNSQGSSSSSTYDLSYSLESCKGLSPGENFLCEQKITKRRIEAEKNLSENCSGYKSSAEHGECIDRNVARILDWREKHPVSMPDLKD